MGNKSSTTSSATNIFSVAVCLFSDEMYGDVKHMGQIVRALSRMGM
jgi:hypothetical protein